MPSAAIPRSLITSDPAPNDAPPDAAPQQGESKSAFAVVRSLAGLTMASRVLGFVRDVLLATALGTGLVADAFFLAWMIPNLFRRLFGDGAFSAALVPVFTEVREQGDEEGARQLVWGAVCRLVVALSAIVLVGELLCFGLLSGPGQAWLSEQVGAGALTKLTHVLDLTRLLLPYLVFICVAGLLGGALNALDRFAIPALAPVVFNAIWIVGLLLCGLWSSEPLPRVRLLSVFLLAGGAVQLLMHTQAMKGAGSPARATWQVDPARLKRVKGLFFSLALGLALFQLNALADGLIAYGLAPEGAVSALYYGNRLVQLPIGVLGVALSTAVFPALARLAKRGDFEGLGKMLDQGVVLGAFVALPAMAGLAVLAEPLVSVLFQRGAFDAESAARTGRVVLLLSPAVVASCVAPVVTRAFYAEEQVTTPVKVGAFCVVLNLVLNLLLVRPLGEAGLALATSISQGLNLVLQAGLYWRRRQARGESPQTWRTLARAGGFALSAALMAALAWAAHRYCPGPELVRVALGVLTGVVVYAGVALALKVEPLRLLLARRR